MIHPITNTERTIFIFVRSHCSGFLKVIVENFGGFKQLFFVHSHYSGRFQKPPFFGYQLSITFSKTSVFVPFLCVDQCEYFQKTNISSTFLYKNGAVCTGLNPFFTQWDGVIALPCAIAD